MANITFQEAFKAGKEAYKAEDYQQAEQYFITAVDIAKNQDEYEWYVDALIELGECYMNLRDGENMFNAWKTAEETSRHFDYKYGLHKSLRRLGHLHHQNDYDDEALDFLKESIQIGIDNEFDPQHVSYMMYIVQKILYKKEEYQEALQYALECEKWAHKYNSINYIDSLLSDISNIYLSLDDYESARRYMTEAFVYSEPKNQKILLQSIAFINRQLNYQADSEFFDNLAKSIDDEGQTNEA